jgi:hypothetical protein
LRLLVPLLQLALSSQLNLEHLPVPLALLRLLVPLLQLALSSQLNLEHLPVLLAQ